MKLSEVLQSKEIVYEEEEKVLKHIKKYFQHVA